MLYNPVRWAAWVEALIHHTLCQSNATVTKLHPGATTSPSLRKTTKSKTRRIIFIAREAVLRNGVRLLGKGCSVSSQSVIKSCHQFETDKDLKHYSRSSLADYNLTLERCVQKAMCLVQYTALLSQRVYFVPS